MGSKLGKLKTWKSERGFGFIKPDDGGKDVFVHVRDLKASGIIQEPKTGDALSFEIEDGDRGPHAVKLTQL